MPFRSERLNELLPSLRSLAVLSLFLVLTALACDLPRSLLLTFEGTAFLLLWTTLLLDLAEDLEVLEDELPDLTAPEDLEDELPDLTLPEDLDDELPDLTALERLLLPDERLLVAFWVLGLLDPLLRFTAERDEPEDRELVAFDLP